MEAGRERRDWVMQSKFRAWLSELGPALSSGQRELPAECRDEPLPVMSSAVVVVPVQVATLPDLCGDVPDICDVANRPLSLKRAEHVQDNLSVLVLITCTCSDKQRPHRECSSLLVFVDNQAQSLNQVVLHLDQG